MTCLTAEQSRGRGSAVGEDGRDAEEGEDAEEEAKEMLDVNALD